MCWSFPLSIQKSDIQIPRFNRDSVSASSEHTFVGFSLLVCLRPEDRYSMHFSRGPWYSFSERQMQTWLKAPKPQGKLDFDEDPASVLVRVC